jgi:hypothetical protein
MAGSLRTAREWRPTPFYAFTPGYVIGVQWTVDES